MPIEFSLACQVYLTFSTLSHKPSDLRKKNIGYRICVLIFCKILSETRPNLRRMQSDSVIKVHGVPPELLTVLVKF